MSIWSKCYVWYHVKERHDIPFLCIRNRLYVRRGGEYLLLRPYSWKKTSERRKPGETALNFAVICFAACQPLTDEAELRAEVLQEKEMEIEAANGQTGNQIVLTNGTTLRERKSSSSQIEGGVRKGRELKWLLPLGGGKQTHNRQVSLAKPSCFSWRAGCGHQTPT